MVVRWVDAIRPRATRVVITPMTAQASHAGKYAPAMVSEGAPLQPQSRAVSPRNSNSQVVGARIGVTEICLEMDHPQLFSSVRICSVQALIQYSKSAQTSAVRIIASIRTENP